MLPFCYGFVLILLFFAIYFLLLKGFSIIISRWLSKRYCPEFVPAKAGAVCRHSGARLASARRTILPLGRQIIPRYAVAYKALNPKTLGRFFGLWSPTFWDEGLFLKMCYGVRIASHFNADGILAIYLF